MGTLSKILKGLFDFADEEFRNSVNRTYDKMNDYERKAKLKGKKLPEEFYNKKGEFEKGAEAYDQFIDKFSN